jgi:hypothetical protein
MPRRVGAVLLASLLFAGCASGGQESLRQGLLRVGIGQKAFLSEWGPPDRTSADLSEEQLRGRVGGWRWEGATLSQGRRPLDVWLYDRYGVIVVFDDGDLVAWRTDKTVEELRTIPPTRARP